MGRTWKAATAANAVTFSNDLTAKDVMAASRETKAPWALAKGFDGTTPIAPFYPFINFPDVTNSIFPLNLMVRRFKKGIDRT